MVNDDGSIQNIHVVYRKETHTDQDLHFSSYHPLEHKRRIVKTLMHRVDTIMSDEGDKVEKKSQLKQSLNMNGYPDWLINSISTVQPSLTTLVMMFKRLR